MTTHFLKDQELALLPEKAILWKNRNTLLIADTHFGKITHFRKSGIAMPAKAAQSNLARFQSILVKYQPAEVIFMGDLFHSEMNTEWLHFKELIKKFSGVVFHLVLGNHDIFHDLSYQHFEVHREPWQCGPFLLSHEPMEDYCGPLYNLAGHLHPGVRMSGPGRQSMRFPCYYFGEHSGLLPAFGEFTGLYLISPKKQDEVFIIADKSVIKAA